MSLASQIFNPVDIFMTPNLHRFTARKNLCLQFAEKMLLQKSTPGRRTMKLMDEGSDTNRLINSRQPLCTARNCSQCLVAENAGTFHPDHSHSRHNIAVLADYFILFPRPACLKISKHVCSGRVKERLGFVCGSIKLC